MKIEITQMHTLALIVTISVSLGLTGCNGNPDESQPPDINQFITKENYVRSIESCVGSKDRLCAVRPAYEKVNKYCSDKKLSEKQCEKIMILVSVKALEYHDQYIKETREATDKIKQMTEDLKRGK